MTRSTFFHVAFFIWIITNVHMCPDVPRLRIVPGSGWDALTNKDTKQVMQLTYDQCKLTNDGRFLIPDNTFAVSLNAQEIQVTSQIFDHWSDYTAPTAAGFKVATDIWPEQFLPLYCSFSNNYHEMKTLQIKHEAFTCRSKLSQVFYRIRTTSNATMIDDVSEKFLKVIEALESNNTEQARFLTEIIVSDYGTHRIRSVDVGAVVVKDDYLRERFLNAYGGNRSRILSASKLSLVEYTGFAWKHKQDADSSLFSEYNDAVLDRKMRFFGGLNWNEGEMSECLVAIDKSGDLLSNLVTSSNFVKASSSLLGRARKMFSDVIRDYYTRNTHRGCTRPKSSNFDFGANLDDGSCKSEVSGYVFGGAYSTFETPHIKKENQDGTINPLTLTLSCPTNFQSQVFTSEFYYYDDSYWEQHYVSCLALANASVGPSYLFGGIYSFYVDNIQTKNKTCPQFYTTLSLPNLGWVFCVNSTDDDLAKQYALPFGGFATVDTDYQCPHGYKRHLAAPFGIQTYASGRDITGYGKVYYCLQEQNLKNVGVAPSLIRLPFETLSTCPAHCSSHCP